MKRCLAFVLSALLIWMSIPAVSAAEDYNDDQFHWGEGICPHANVTEKAAVASTCISRGNEAHTVCDDCGAAVVGSKKPLPFADHTYDNACDTICNICGDTREVEDHIYDNDCDTNCNECDAVREVNPHPYEENVITPPTCGEKGLKEYTCSVCGDTYTEEIPATGEHTYDNACDTDCNGCNAVREVEPHNYVENVALAPTCGVTGTMRYTCSVCGDTYTEEIPATGEHTYDNDCDTGCNGCNTVREVEPHNYVENVALAPTCGAEGTMRYTCSVCGDTYTEEIPATGEHTYDNDCDTICNVCNAVREVEPHNYVENVALAPTCGETGTMRYTCSVCGDTYTKEIPATGEHTYDNACDIGCNGCDYERIVGDHLSDSSEPCQDGHCVYCGVLVPATTTCQRLESAICKDTVCQYCAKPMPATTTCQRVDSKPCRDTHCQFCNKVMPATADHAYDNACDVDCNVCGDVRKVGDHVYSSTVTQQPTCEGAGVRTYVCDHCGHTYTEVVDALGHKYNAVVTDPDCVNDGYTTHTCQRCGDVYTDSETDALGHNYDSVVTNPDCENGGYTTHTCQRCGDTYTDSETNALGHDYDSVVTDPDCENDGYTTHTCRRCGKTYTDSETDALGHTEVTIPAVDATCTATGLTAGVKCSVCNKVLVAPTETAKLPHTEVADEYQAPTCTETGLTAGSHCGVCGTVIAQQTVIQPIGHTYETEVTAPTCEEQGYTTYTCHCGDVKVDDYVDALGHTEETIPGKDATCTATGLTAGVKCSVCQKTLTEQTEIKMLPHTEETIPGKDATCTETGLTAGVKCSECGETLVAPTETDKLPHTEETIPAVDATCTETGLTAGVKCSECGEILVAPEETPALKHEFNDDNVCDRCGETRCEIAGHKEVEIPAVGATCTANGWTAGVKCSVCGEILVAPTETDKLPHTEETIPAVGATCTATGWTAGVKCSECGETLVAPTETDKLPHTEETIPAVGATCTATGWTAGVKCSVCGETLVAPTETEMLPHTEETIPGKDATCTATGLTDGVKCSECGETLTAQEVIAKLSHTTVVDDYKAPTCTETGLTEGSHCSVCGTKTIHQVVIPAVGHTYATETVNPTCDKGGYTTYTCHCGDTYTGDETAALGHDFDNEYDAACGRCEYVRADVNNDGKLNNRDLGLLQQYLNGWAVEDMDADAADIYADGFINNRDLAQLQRLLNW